MAPIQTRLDHATPSSKQGRESRLKSALFHGAGLTLENPSYMQMLRTITEELLRVDREPCDLTVAALGIAQGQAQARILANEPGIMAGLEEAFWFYTHFGLTAKRMSADGQALKAGQDILHLEGEAGLLLSLERVGLNLLQRMCGIATASHRLAEAARRHSANTHVIATRKTPWGLLDKRAAHLGGAGTHRLGLGDAILIKTNHLKLFAPREEDAIPIALRHAWEQRNKAAFIEVEVTGQDGALAASRAFRDLQASAPNADSYPCIIMLDNMSSGEVGGVVAALRAESLWDSVLVEVSGGISEETLGAYADCSVDAISIGSLTHSCRALDLRCKLEIRAGENTRTVRKDA